MHGRARRHLQRTNGCHGLPLQHCSQTSSLSRIRITTSAGGLGETRESKARSRAISFKPKAEPGSPVICQARVGLRPKATGERVCAMSPQQSSFGPGERAAVRRRRCYSGNGRAEENFSYAASEQPLRANGSSAAAVLQYLMNEPAEGEYSSIKPPFVIGFYFINAAKTIHFVGFPPMIKCIYIMAKLIYPLNTT